MEKAWYIETKKSLPPGLLVKVECETINLCTYNPDKALKFESKKKVMEFIKSNNLLKQWKHIEI